LKLWNSIMSGLMLAPLALAGCPSDDTTEETGAGSSTTETAPTTTGDDTTGSTTAVAESSSGAPTTTGEDTTVGEDTTTGEGGNCEFDPPLPKAPVDCSTAKGVIDGSVIIDEDNPQDIAMLEGVVEVTGSIRLSGLDVADLNFMACVQTVGGDVTIFDNDSLTNIDGLWSLESIGTDFVFSQNDAIVDFNGVPNVVQLVNNLIIRENASLERITGFHSLVGINGSGTDPDTGETIGGNITIQENPVLRNIDGLVGLLVVNGTLAINNNPMLCQSSVACVGLGIVQPAVPPDDWTTVGNDDDC